ncbi:peptidase S8/S53 domain-containing protein [Fusarium oxysporum Fo47]|uniref:Peptidase S8/S53 domain-containing protein n=1 Tax=Fusarium oxysporum Fo47 TaxID=660027 RepID=W9JHC1_FUSOX|nr:peptidase S8/S53 domain-containing protein [Fusarium oxysporum Fo47]EWZ29065.1 hypothetical protein FOZG_17353 [Fusarium oxysporum Fo47]QKD57471.2 peptidase S8/S53 domain-containing protein [Fusarium oxysporum Fo47]
MKLTTALFAFSGLAGLALGKAVNQNIDDELVVPNSYIIIYKSSVTPSDRKKHEEAITKKAKSNGKEGIIETIEPDGFKGYIAKMTSSELKDVVNSDLVASIERDTILNLTAVAAPSFGLLRKRAYTQQLNSPWGLARISQRSNKRGLDAQYYYDTATKAGINVYVLDTGIRTTHKEFSGRAVWGANFVPGSPNRDENGHGMHVAGTIGGKTFGVAKNCNLIAVKVCDKDGQTIASIGLQGLVKKSVINISITGDYSAAANSFIKAATDAGLTIVVSAGNKGDDASFYSPSSAPSAITVGASDADDWRTPWSNFGSSVDIFAPGTGILSSWHLSDTSSRYLSGTSMAAPYVAGLAAYFLSNDRIEGYAAVTRRILDAAIKDSVIDAMGSSNRLAYNANGK